MYTIIWLATQVAQAHFFLAERSPGRVGCKLLDAWHLSLIAFEDAERSSALQAGWKCRSRVSRSGQAACCAVSSGQSLGSEWLSVWPSDASEIAPTSAAASLAPPSMLKIDVPAATRWKFIAGWPKLTKAADFERFTGSRMKLMTRQPINNNRTTTFEGRLESFPRIILTLAPAWPVRSPQERWAQRSAEAGPEIGIEFRQRREV